MKILVTGTSCGIGQKLARHLGSLGHEIWGLARTPHEEFLQECQARQISFRYSLCDISEWKQVFDLSQTIAGHWGRLEALICGAAVQGPIGPARCLDPAEWVKSIMINLNGTFFCIRAFVDLLLQAERRAKIICFSGGGSTSPRPNFTPYAVAKAGVVRMVENLAREWECLPLDINAIAPGPVHTHMTEEVLRLGPGVVGEKEFRTASEQVSQGGTSFHLYAGLVEFLLSPDSDGVSGRLLSAVWDPWRRLSLHREALRQSDIFTLRRILPGDRGQNFD